jgi:alpha/beta hydrolase family protein
MVTSGARRGERLVRRTLIVLLLLWITSVVVYVSVAFAPAGFAPSVLQSDDLVVVEQTATALEFRPRARSGPAGGFILYPGCPVPVEAYAPLARQMAEHGYSAYVMRVAYRCATAETQQQALFDHTDALIRSAGIRWVLGGHSRGGALAAQYVFGHPAAVSALVLIGTTSPRDLSLAGLHIPVVKVLGTRDGVAREDVAVQYAALLPPTTRWVRIQGGNHIQFAYYRFQLWDRRATISREAQQAQTLQAILETFSTPSR